MDHSAELLDEHRRFEDLLAGADRTAEVATCPGWDVRALVTHVGRGHRWAATMVADRMSTPLGFRDVPDGKSPDDPEAAVQWLTAGATQLLDAVAVEPDVPVWTFLGPKPASWWIRRRLHEATVHRADAALALGAELDMPADRAADGLSEWLDLVAARPASDEPPLADGATLHLHASDTSADSEWLLRGSGGSVAWTPEHAKADAGIHGPALTLLLMTTRRLPADALPVHGDADVWHTWLVRTGF